VNGLRENSLNFKELLENFTNAQARAWLNDLDPDYYLDRNYAEQAYVV
jgi:hypothetical protein